jgi:hypothetical protein
MEYEINTQCPACDGYGIHENQIAVDEFVDSDCHECEGSGLIMYTGIYDSEEDAKADYPESFIKPSKWTRAQAVQRGEMIAKQIFSPT